MQGEGYATSEGAPPEGGNGTGPITADEVRLQLDRILNSPAFQRSDRLQRFLRFVCESALRGEANQLHEYLIGSEVFGRGPQYSPHEDGIVRRQAHALRRKLQEYYEKDGAADLIRIELPVGRYVPQFRRAGPHAPPEIEPDGELASLPALEPARPAVFGWILAALSGGLLFAAGWFVGLRYGSQPVAAAAGVAPEVRRIWGPWFDSRAGATLCFSNPLTAIVKHYPARLSTDSVPPRHLLAPDQERLFRSVVSLPPGGFLYFAPAISQTKMGEAIAAVHLTSLFAGAGVPMRATQSRFVSWEDLTRENMILLGHNEANPWLDRILAKYPFQLVQTTNGRSRAIVNSQPHPGETSEFQIHYGNTSLTPTEEYALISMLPGVDARHRLLLLSGLNTQATQIAAEYLSTPERLSDLIAALEKAAPGHNGPWYFQAVLRTEVHDKVPTKASLVTLKVLGE